MFAPKKFRFLLRQRGFTLIELLLVIVIVGLLTTAAIPSFLQSLRGAQFRGQVAQVVELVEKARTQALASEIDTNQKIPPGGYGILFRLDDTNSPNSNESQVVLFVDDWNAADGKKVNVDYANATGRVLPDGAYTAGTTNANGDTILGTVDFSTDKFVKITGVRGKVLNELNECHVGNDASIGFATAIFQPPYGETVIKTGGFYFSNLEVEFTLGTDNSRRTLRLQQATGAVEVVKNAKPPATFCNSAH